LAALGRWNFETEDEEVHAFAGAMLIEERLRNIEAILEAIAKRPVM
jgi:hypothetical protein